MTGKIKPFLLLGKLLQRQVMSQNSALYSLALLLYNTYIHNSVALINQALHLKPLISSLGFETDGVDLITLAT